MDSLKATLCNEYPFTSCVLIWAYEDMVIIWVNGLLHERIHFDRKKTLFSQVLLKIIPFIRLRVKLGFSNPGKTWIQDVNELY